MAVGATHVFSWLSHTSSNTTFLSKATDYFSHMLLQRWEAKIHRKEKSPQPGIKLTTSRSWVRHAHHWATWVGQRGLVYLWHMTSFEPSFDSLPNNKILDESKLKDFAEVHNIYISKIEFYYDMDRKHCGKRRKCCLTAFLPFHTMFSKGFFFRVVKSQDCVVKS